MPSTSWRGRWTGRSNRKIELGSSDSSNSPIRRHRSSCLRSTTSRSSLRRQRARAVSRPSVGDASPAMRWLWRTRGRNGSWASELSPTPRRRSWASPSSPSRLPSGWVAETSAVATIAQVASTIAGAALVGRGVLSLRSSRAAAYHWFMRGLLVWILVTQVFVFYSSSSPASAGSSWTLSPTAACGSPLPARSSPDEAQAKPPLARRDSRWLIGTKRRSGECYRAAARLQAELARRPLRMPRAILDGEAGRSSASNWSQTMIRYGVGFGPAGLRMEPGRATPCRRAGSGSDRFGPSRVDASRSSSARSRGCS